MNWIRLTCTNGDVVHLNLDDVSRIYLAANGAANVILRSTRSSIYVKDHAGIVDAIWERMNAE